MPSPSTLEKLVISNALIDSQKATQLIATQRGTRYPSAGGLLPSCFLVFPRKVILLARILPFSEVFRANCLEIYEQNMW